MLITSIGTGVTCGYAPIGRSGTLTTIITVKRALGNIGLIVAHTVGNFQPQTLGTGGVVYAALTLGAIDARYYRSVPIVSVSIFRAHQDPIVFFADAAVAAVVKTLATVQKIMANSIPNQFWMRTIRQFLSAQCQFTLTMGAVGEVCHVITTISSIPGALLDVSFILVKYVVMTYGSLKSF